MTKQRRPGDSRSGDAAGDKEGIVLVVVVSLLVALAVLATALFTILSGDIRNAAYYDRAVEALHNADAGAQYVFARLRKDADSGTLSLGSAILVVNYPVPAGLDFDPVTNLVRLADGESYTYTVVGRSGTSRARLEAVVHLLLGDGRTAKMGAFGNEEFEVKPNGNVYSYHSDTEQNPTSSTGEAEVGTNGDMGGDDDAIDGTIHLGEAEDGTPATYPHEFTTPAEVIREDRIDPDPLGVVSGALAQAFAAAVIANDNASAVGGTHVGNIMTIEGNVTLTAGDYYVDEIDLTAHTRLTIDATAGPVSVYLTGPATMMPNSEMIVNPPVASNFSLFSNSSEELKFFPRLGFVGMVYAPLASVTMQPNGNFYGSVWGNEAKFMPGGEVYIDIDSLSTWYTRLGLVDTTLASWKQVR